MTKILNKSISKAFKKAKIHLWNGITPDLGEKTAYICFVIDKTGYSFTNTICKSIIMSRLQSCHSLKGWLFKNAPVDFDATNHSKIQQTRLNWLNSLIEEFDKEGYYND